MAAETVERKFDVITGNRVSNIRIKSVDVRKQLKKRKIYKDRNKAVTAM